MTIPPQFVTRLVGCMRAMLDRYGSIANSTKVMIFRSIESEIINSLRLPNNRTTRNSVRMALLEEISHV